MRVILSVLFVCVLASTAFGINGDMGATTDPLTDGSFDRPWLIEDFADFNEFASNPNYWEKGVYTRLMCDIDLDPALPGRQTYTTAVIAPDMENNTNNDFEGTPFYSDFDGNGYIIRNLKINAAGADKDYLGLFGRIGYADIGYIIPGGLVKNLGVEQVDIRGGDRSCYRGGLCGLNEGTIINCYSTGIITDGAFGLGGLCGSNGIFGSYGTGINRISNCYSNVDVTGGDGSDFLGGLCGNNGYNSTIINCYATGAVTGGVEPDRLGGLCGESSGDISNCYATGAVTGGDNSYSLGGLCGRSIGTVINCYVTGDVTGGDNSRWLGGLLGYSGGDVTNCFATGAVTGGNNSDHLGGLCGRGGSINNCYAIGAVTGGSYLGGLCGSGGDSSNCFWDVETSGMTTSSGGIGKTTAQMKTLSTFTDAGWDFEADWDFGEDSVNMGYPYLGWQMPLSGKGTLSEPFLIEDINDFHDFASDSYYWVDGVCTMLMCDIDLSGTVYTAAVIPPDKHVVYPNRHIEEPFNGVFDGNGHVILNLTIDTAGADDGLLGLFARISPNGSVKNLGIEQVDIKCGIGSSSIGGLCGWNEGIIVNCYSTGFITGGRYGLGGLCGCNGEWPSSEGPSIISNCYSTVSINSGDNAGSRGGLCGYNLWGTISNCYSTGSVTGGVDFSSLGGLCGLNGGGFVSNCFWDTQTSGLAVGCNQTPGYVGRITNVAGKTTVQMQTRQTFTDGGWDFVGEDINGTKDFWRMPHIESGYPMLSWQKGIIVDMQFAAAFSRDWLKDGTAGAMLTEKAWWKLDETADAVISDSSGNGYDGVLMYDENVVTADAHWAEGYFNNALDLTGVNSYMQVPFVLNPADGSFSAFAWVKNDGGSPQGIISQYDLVNTGDDQLGTGRYWLQIGSGGYITTQLRTPGQGGLVSTESLISDSWAHVGIVWDGQKRHLYLDGLKIISDAASIDGLESCTGQLYIGTNKYGGAAFWNGLIDDVRIYDFALSQAQIDVIYQGQSIEAVCIDRPQGDYSGDCVVGIEDLVIISKWWLAGTD